MDIINQSLDIARNPKHTRWIAPLLIAADAALCAGVITKIPYTEIDWTTYMEHIALYNKGERDYYKIEGATGPLVYPGAHVLIYRLLYAVTDQGRDIQRAQWIFAGLYLGCLGLVMQVYRAAKVPPYVLPLLILSKRLHSIFMLRLFNDCFAVLGLWAAIWAYQRQKWHWGTLFYSTGLNVKMTLLLPLPAVGILTLLALGSREAITQALIILQISVGFGFPFRKWPFGYFGRAFELSRQFLYKWTVNWRFVDEETFLSRPFALALLAIHVTLLVAFLTRRWNKPAQRPLPDFLKLVWSESLDQDQITRRVGPRFIATTMLTATAIGMLCARSLHYQFYVYVAWTTPFLLWRAGFHPPIQYALWAAQEWAWNVYPSTPASSATVVAVLAISVAGVYYNTSKEFDSVTANGGPSGGATHEHAE